MLPSLIVTDPPADEPVTLGEAKLWIRHVLGAADTIEDDLLERCITAARLHLEEVLARKLLTQTVTLHVPRFPAYRDPLPLQGGTVQSVTSVQYTDPQLVEQTMPAADYQLDATDPYVARLAPAPGVSWPGTTIENLKAVRVTYVAGYGDAATDVPAELLIALEQRVAELYEHRGESLTGGAWHEAPAYARLIEPHRVRTFLE